MNKLRTNLNVHNLLWLALILALAGSLSHLAAVFASIDGNKFLGWLQAIAIDTGLFALSYSLKGQKAKGKKTNHIWLGIILFTGISIYGNLAYGIISLTGKLPPWIIISKPYILAASLPALVLYLADGQSEPRPKLSVKKETVPAKKTRSTPTKKGTAKKDKITTRQKKVSELARQNMTIPEIAEKLNVSEGTVKNDKRQLNGQMEKIQ
jgi:DNA-binding CsgD family transcriptional regulator